MNDKEFTERYSADGLPFNKMNASQALAALNQRYPGTLVPENTIVIENPEQAKEDFEQVLEDIQSAYKDHGYSEGLDDWLSELPLGDEAAGFESVLKMLTGKSSKELSPKFISDLKAYLHTENGLPWGLLDQGNSAQRKADDLPFSKMNASQALAALNQRYPGILAPENTIAVENPEQAKEDFEQVLEDLQSAYKDHGYSEGLDDWLSELPIGDEAAGFESVLKMLTGKSSKELSPKFLNDLKAYLHTENGLPWGLLDQRNPAQQEADDRQSRITNAVRESE